MASKSLEESKQRLHANLGEPERFERELGPAGKT